MSRLAFDKKDQHPDDDEWTTARFEDECFLDLARVRNEIKVLGDDGVTGKKIHYKKYYRQAISKMYRIPLTEQNSKREDESVPFVIDFKDLSSRVQSEFLELCRDYSKPRVTLLLKEIVTRIFENIDFNYAQMSVMKKLRVKINGI